MKLWCLWEAEILNANLFRVSGPFPLAASMSANVKPYLGFECWGDVCRPKETEKKAHQQSNKNMYTLTLQVPNDGHASPKSQVNRKEK